MKTLKLITCLLFPMVLLTGCVEHWVFPGEKVISDPKDRVFPVESGRYFHFMPLDDKDRSSFDAEAVQFEEIKGDLSQQDLVLLSSGKLFPLLLEPHSLEKQKKCYVLHKEGESSESDFVVSFEKIEGQVYLIEAVEGGNKCKSKGDKATTYYLYAGIRDGYIYFLADEGSKEGQHIGEWLVSLSNIAKWYYGVESKTVEGRDEFVLTNTEAFKAYFIQNSARFVNSNFGYALYRGDESVTYKDEIALYDKIEALKAKKKEEKKAKKEAEEAKIEAEKNDGFIRYAFGRKLGDIHASDYDSITYHTVTNSVEEKSPYFQDYYELTTPQTKKVFSIYGVSELIGAQACSDSAEEVRSVLSQKYEPFLEYTPVSFFFRGLPMGINKSFLYFRRIEKGNQLIELICVTDSDAIKLRREKHKASGCQLEENFFNDKLAAEKNLKVSAYNLYYQVHGEKGYSDYGNRIVSMWIPGGNVLYPAPVPALSSTYSPNYRKCGLDKDNAVFRLFIRYSDKNLENLIDQERKDIERAKTLNNPKAKGL